MCDHNDRLIKLHQSVIRMRPLDETNADEMNWWKGTLNGLKLALQQVPPDQKAA